MNNRLWNDGKLESYLIVEKSGHLCFDLWLCLAARLVTHVDSSTVDKMGKKKLPSLKEAKFYSIIRNISKHPTGNRH